MAQSYTPGLKVARRQRHRSRRILPIQGEVLVKPGDRVNAEEVVARTFMPGDVTPINLGNQLSLPPADAAAAVLKKEGERIEAGEVLARSQGMFGFFRSEYKSRVAGTIETISSVTGQVIIRGEPIPVAVRAFLAGEVVELLPGSGVVVEADATFIQGIFGVGGEAYGPLRLAVADYGEELTPGHIRADMRGQIVVGGARMTGAAIRQAIEAGVAALISGGMDDQDLREILGYDLGVAVTGSEPIGITLIVTEGFGEIAMAARTFRLLKAREGAPAAVNGATQIRAGVLRPEIVIPWGDEEADQAGDDRPVAGQLETGCQVRLIREPHFGLIGSVTALPPEPQVLESGSKARVLEVEVAGTGEHVVVPRANVELIED